MKSWKTPELNIYNMRMEENIAASGDTAKSYETFYIYYDVGGITRGGNYYQCEVGTSSIQDTSVSYTYGNGMYTVPSSQTGAISGCLA